MVFFFFSSRYTMVVKKAIVKAVTKAPLVLGEYYNGLVVVTGAVKLIRQRKLLLLLL